MTLKMYNPLSWRKPAVGAIVTAVFLSLFSGTAFGQTITGSVTGSVRDSSGLAVVGASVKIRQVATGAERSAGTNERGDFVFSSLQPGGYTVTVSQTGFKTVEHTGIELTASEVLNVGAITLELGAVSETVTVAATGAAVQTVSSERSGVVTSDQVSNLLIRSRTVFSLMQTLPGVVDQGGAESIERKLEHGG